MCLMALAFIGGGVWKTWSAFRFAGTAIKVEGTFAGYREFMSHSTIKDSHGFKTRVKETYPMFSYRDAAGRSRIIVGRDVVVFQWLESGDRVTVLVDPDNPENARLGSLYYLYGSGAYLFAGGSLAILLLVVGFKKISLFIGPSAAPGQTALMKFVQGLAGKKLPLGDVVIMFGGFVLLAAAVMGAGAYFVMKSQDPSLVEALQAGNYDAARTLAASGRGIDGKNADGEPALIVALKADRPDVAGAILSHWTSVNVRTAKGVSGLALAAANGDHQTVATMIKKGAETSSLPPSLVYRLIVKGDIMTLAAVFSSKLFNLDAKFMRLTYGDHAVMHGKADVVRLIQEHNGPFQAPASFIALVLDDSNALKQALVSPDACKTEFNRLFLYQFAQKIDKKRLLEQAGGCVE